MAATTRPRRRAKRKPPQFKMPRVLTPWLLPEDLKPSHEMTEEEIALEAQEARPLLREIGWRDSAVMHPNETNIRYLRTCHYLGKLPMKPYFLQVLTMLGVSIFFGILFLFGPEQDNAELALNKFVYVIVGMSVGLLFGTGVGYSVRTMTQFWTAHAFARIAQKRREDNGTQRTVAIYELPLPRLAFVDRHHEQIFSGIEERSGFSNGRINLETNVELSLVTDPRELYMPGMVRPCVSDFTGVSTSRRHSLNGMAKDAGRINAEKQQQLETNDIANWVNEHKGLTFFIIAAVVSMIVLFIGVDIDISNAKEMFG